MVENTIKKLAMEKHLRFKDSEVAFEVDARIRSGEMVNVASDRAEVISSLPVKESLTKIEEFTGEIVEKFYKSDKSLSSIELKVGVKFQAEAGAVIAKTAAEGALELVLKWERSGNSTNQHG